MSPTPDSLQTAKGEARKSAEAAPAADPKIAEQALEDAKNVERKGESSVQPVYKTQGDVAGENVHRDTDAIISEFDDPSANTIQADSDKP